MSEFSINLPSILVAMPTLADPTFNKSVLLLAEHNHHGAMGFIINRPTDFKLTELIDMPTDIPPSIPAWYGGPVGAESGLILHNQKETPGDVPLRDGITFSSNMGTLQALIEGSKQQMEAIADSTKELPQNFHPFRFIVGYAGWGAGQLEDELRAGTWMQIPASNHLIFGTSWKDMWTESMNSIGVTPDILAPANQPYLN